ncbi:NADP-dependent oxidoreductase domain-containing protein [Aspergillus cavernicola]|uniref:NADP-dependent oxidoreductase domain-containing protein n=1 Tax=Aspergillus cavernicola TaxID=176166 RepID=A0ABR4I7R6_9EURO
MAQFAPTIVLDKPVGPIGYGLMGFCRPWAPTEYSVAVKVMKTALEQGATFWNGGLHYGTPNANSLHLLKYYFTQHPEDIAKITLSIKGGYNMATQTPDGTPEGIRASVEAALSILDGVKKIDIFECARVDPAVPIETTIETLAALVKEGKIGGIGVSEASAATLRRAHAVHPIAAAEIELSLFTSDPLSNGVLDTCHELGIPLIAYSPLGRGFLTGQFRKYEDLAEKDFRRYLPRFQPDAFDNNIKLVEAVDVIATRKSVTVAQVAIAWVRAQGAIPIPGATTEKRVLENYHDVTLSVGELEEIQRVLDTLPVQGERYGGQHETLLNL